MTSDSADRDTDGDSDEELSELDDRRDRDELRNRYYVLLQEVRVVLPGVQVLVAFLLTAPFAERFDRLDRTGRAVFTASTVGALCSVVALLAPTVFHRVGERTARRARLRWSLRLTILGVVLLAFAVATALWCVVRLVHGAAAAWLITGPFVLGIVLVWVVLPTVAMRPRR